MESLDNLQSVFAEMQKSSIIFADKKIKNILKCLAFYDEFKEVLAYANMGFNFDQEKQKAKDGFQDTGKLRIPKGDKNIVAFVSNLLLDFDNGEEDFIAFSAKYFSGADRQECCNLCFDSLFKPFLSSFKTLVKDGVVDVTHNAKSIEFAPDGLKNQTEYIFVEFVKAVQNSPYSADERNELLFILEGFAGAFDSRDTLIIRAMWLAVRRILKDKKLCKKEIALMDETLKLYLLLK